MLGNEITEASRLSRDKLRVAAQRFGVARAWSMSKADLLEALEYTAWQVAAEVAHTAIREHRPEHGQPEGTCALCFRDLSHHPGPVPGRMGWPRDWSIKLGWS